MIIKFIGDLPYDLLHDIFQCYDADSIAGLILEKTGEMPKKDQECEIGGLKIKTVAVSKKRIEQVKVTLI